MDTLKEIEIEGKKPETNGNERRDFVSSFCIQGVLQEKTFVSWTLEIKNPSIIHTA